VEALEEARPIVRDLRGFARQARPVGKTLAQLLTSFEKTGGINNVMDFFYLSAMGINGFDAFGHYLRAALIVNTCSSYSTTPVGGCSANFRKPEAEEASVSRRGEGDRTLARTRRVLAGEDPEKVNERDGYDPDADRTTDAERAGAGKAAPRPPAAAPPQPAPAPAASPSPATRQGQDGLLDYLFGGDDR
jgi:hypothetical protein